MNPKGPKGEHHGAVSQRQRILALMRDGAVTRNEISRIAGIPIQSVCLRVAELIKDRSILRGQERRCTITGRTNETLLIPRGQLSLEAFRVTLTESAQNNIPAETREASRPKHIGQSGTPETGGSA